LLFKYLNAKDAFESVGQTMDLFVSEPKFASSDISKSVPVFGPVSVEIQRSVNPFH